MLVTVKSIVVVVPAQIVSFPAEIDNVPTGNSTTVIVTTFEFAVAQILIGKPLYKM